MKISLSNRRTKIGLVGQRLKQGLGHPLLLFLGGFFLIAQLYAQRPGYALGTWGALALLAYGANDSGALAAWSKKRGLVLGGLVLAELLALALLFPGMVYPLLAAFGLLLFFAVVLPWWVGRWPSANPFGAMLVFGFAAAGLFAWAGQFGLVRLFLTFGFFAFFFGALDLAWRHLCPGKNMDPREG